ncbi:bacterial regulatory helix-turn-helix, lysR family protein [Paraburkholderia xenovorans LB400]|uniref:Transcriptional regulator, LysR family n=1 Tax=Paraburkholderia xenovorans (strain LB400) TaxID=266265 RepID=Q13GF3_PARXL|nr:LysR family transcriptional regulator [Paraburkholderia xenovorans]ABE36836.1 transcriptional regulator, LysR family [Paraburkholderia xenovorans LB400]AIP35082.1 bacterial regulatory helix-turn-helix, lysR family protein [Paraburkholderia xenovorans LB400]
MLHLNLLQVFISVAENSSFTLAGSEMHRTQSAISMKIKRLEEILGVPVFERSGKSIELTKEGAIFLTHSRRILQLVDEAMSAVGAVRKSNVVRLGCVEDYAVRTIPKILVDFWVEHPDVHIEMGTGDSASLLDRLGDDFDVVLAEHPLNSGEGEVVCTDSLVWGASANHSPHLQEPIPVAFRSQGALERQWACSALNAAGRPWRLACLSAGIGTLQTAVDAGLAVGVFKASTLAGALNRLTPADNFPQLPDVEMALHVMNDGFSQPSIMQLVKKLRESLQRPQLAAAHE